MYEFYPKFWTDKGDIQIRTFDYTHLGFQFSDFQLESFVDPKPVEL